MLEPKELGKLFGISAIKVNKILAAAGLQEKETSGWSPTEKGKPIATRHAWFKGGKSGYNLKWDVQKIKTILTPLLAA